MSEFFFHLLIFALGMSWSLLALPRLGAVVCCVQAYPIGLTLWVLISLLLLLTGLPFDAPTLFCAAALVGAAGVGLILRAHSRRSEAHAPLATHRLASRLLAATTLFSLAAWVATRFDISVWTFDSHVLVAIARSIAHRGEIVPEMAREIGSRSVFQVLVQATSLLLDKTYLSANPSVLAASFVAIFAVLGLRGLRHAAVPSARAIATTALTVAAIATPYFFIVQVFYIHEALAGAVYLFLAATAFWFAELERERAWLPFAFLYLFAFSLQRVDGPIVAMILLVIVCGPSRLPARSIHRGVLIFSGASLAWFGIQIFLQGSGGDWVLRPKGPNLDPGRLRALMAAYMVSTGVLLSLRRPRIAKLRDWIPSLILAFMVCALVAAAIWRPPYAEAAVVAVIGHAASRSWGGIWYVFLVLGALSLLLPKVPHNYILAHGSLATLLFILLLSLLHHKFGLSWGDSFNRMMTYLIPIFGFYVLMAYGRALRFLEREKRRELQPEPVTAT